MNYYKEIKEYSKKLTIELGRKYKKYKLGEDNRNYHSKKR